MEATPSGQDTRCPKPPLVLRRLPKSCRPCSQQLLPQRGSKNHTAGTVLWTEGYGRVWYWCHKLNLRLQQIKGFLQGCYRLKKLEMFRLQSVSSRDCHCNRAAIKACAWESTLGKFWSTTNGVLTPCTYCFSLSGETFTKACRPWLKSYENVIHLASQIWPYWPGYEWNTPKPSHSKPLVDLKKGQLRTRSSTVTLVRGSICCPKFIMQLALPQCNVLSSFWFSSLQSGDLWGMPLSRAFPVLIHKLCHLKKSFWHPHQSNQSKLADYLYSAASSMVTSFEASCSVLPVACIKLSMVTTALAP